MNELPGAARYASWPAKPALVQPSASEPGECSANKGQAGRALRTNSWDSGALRLCPQTLGDITSQRRRHGEYLLPSSTFLVSFTSVFANILVSLLVN